MLRSELSGAHSLVASQQGSCWEEGASEWRKLALELAGGRARGLNQQQSWGENTGTEANCKAEVGRELGRDLGSTHEQSLGLNLPEVAGEKGRKAAGTAMPRQGEDNSAGPGNELCTGMMSAVHLSWIC